MSLRAKYNRAKKKKARRIVTPSQVDSQQLVLLGRFWFGWKENLKCFLHGQPFAVLEANDLTQLLQETLLVRCSSESSYAGKLQRNKLFTKSIFLTKLTTTIMKSNAVNTTDTGNQLRRLSTAASCCD